jgi:hypothetical protein
MTVGKARKLEIAERRAEVLRRFRAGESQRAIARELGLTEMCVSRDLAAIKAAWKESSVRDFDRERGRILGELQAVREAAWSAFERSKAEAEAATVTRRKVRVGRRVFGNGDGADEGGDDSGHLVPDAETTQVSRERRDGESRWLSVITQTLAQEADLLGLSPQRGEPSTAPMVVSFRLHQPGCCGQPAVVIDQPAPSAQCGLKELPPGADPDDYEVIEVPDGEVLPPQEGPGGGAATPG